MTTDIITKIDEIPIYQNIGLYAHVLQSLS